jgi:hypothetical protein
MILEGSNDKNFWNIFDRKDFCMNKLTYSIKDD